MQYDLSGPSEQQNKSNNKQNKSRIRLEDRQKGQKTNIKQKHVPEVTWIHNTSCLCSIYSSH